MRSKSKLRIIIFSILILIAFCYFSHSDAPFASSNIMIPSIVSQARNLVTAFPADRSYDHVIITVDSLRAHFDTLANWHTQRGLKDTVILVDSIYTNYSGDSNYVKIRNFVIFADTNWGTEYFLMGGHQEIIPTEPTTFGDAIYYYSDQYYGDYNDDWEYEVCVGRYTVKDTTQARRAVERVMRYEKNPPLDDYVLEMTLLGMRLSTSDTIGTTRGEELNETLISQCIPQRFNLIKVYDSHGGDHRDSFYTALNSGAHLVNHLDHSPGNLISRLGSGVMNHDWSIGFSDSTRDVDSLENYHKLSIIVAPSNCSTLKPYAANISEHMVFYTDSIGSVAFVGHTLSVGAGGDAIDSLWWNQFFDDNRTNYNIGKILADTKDAMQLSDSSENWQKRIQWAFNIQGDPAMPIWTDTPESLYVTIPDTFFTHQQCTIWVEDSESAAVESSYVCLMKSDGLYYRDYTDSNGRLIFNDFPEVSTGSLSVCATKHNYLPSISYETAIDSLFGSLEGRVKDIYGESAENVYVSVKIDAWNMRYDWTDRSGYFEIDSIYVDSLEADYEIVYFDTCGWRKVDTVTVKYWHTENLGDVEFVKKDDAYSCSYVPGDVNDDGSVLTGDYTYLVNYLCYGGDPPPVSCWYYPEHRWLRSAADATGNCSVTLADATRIAQYLLGQADPPDYCPYTPPE